MRRGALALLFVAGVALATPARGGDEAKEDSRDRVSLTVRGRATAPAESLELELVVSGSSDEAKASERVHREKLQKVLAALSGKEPVEAAPGAKKRRRPREGGGEEDKKPSADDEAILQAAAALEVSVREGTTAAGIDARSQNEETDDNGNPKVKEMRFRMASSVHVTIKGLDKAPAAAVRVRLADLVDRAIAAGADSGLGTDTGARLQVRFSVKDVDALRSKAYADAVTKAKARGDELARLAGGKSARLLRVAEDEVPAERQGYMTNGEAAPAGLEHVLGLIGERHENGVPLKPGTSPTTSVATEVQLTVVFEVVGAAK